MFDTICGLIPYDPDYAPRTRILDILDRVLNGTIYDVLPYQFHEERGLGGTISLYATADQAYGYALSRIVVEDSVALLFSEGHFPTIDCPDTTTQEALLALCKEAHLNRVMTEAAICGSVGSVAILMRILRGRVFFRVLDTRYLTPVWDPEAPDSLSKITERYKVPGAELAGIGYDIADLEAEYWFERQWDAEYETWLTPVAVGEKAVPEIEFGTQHAARARVCASGMDTKLAGQVCYERCQRRGVHIPGSYRNPNRDRLSTQPSWTRPQVTAVTRHC